MFYHRPVCVVSRAFVVVKPAVLTGKWDKGRSALAALIILFDPPTVAGAD
jgi:hypothetical protein